MRRPLGILLAAVIGLALAFGAFTVVADPRRGDAVAADTVTLRDTAFDLPVITVAVGTDVTWVFDDAEPHNVEGDGWRSPDQLVGTWTRTFETAGTHDYVCTLHPLAMRGRVLVTG